MLTIISPMEEELAGIRQALTVHDMPGATALHVVGIGRDAVERSLKGLLPALRQARDGDESPSGLLLLGFAGAVDLSLATGDLVLAKRYCRLVPQPEPLTLARVAGKPQIWSHAQEEIARLRAGLASEGFACQTPDMGLSLPPGMASGEQVIPRRAVFKFLEPGLGLWQRAKEALSQNGLTAVETDSMTVSRTVTDTETKRDLYQKYQVGTVNMEDYWVARLAIAAKVPFLSVRAVLDTADQGVPSYLLGLSGRPGRAAAATLSMPWRAPTMLRMARQMRQAQQSLARFVLAFIGHLQEEVQPGPGASP